MTDGVDDRLKALRGKFIERCRQERALLGPSTDLSEDDRRRVGDAAHKIAGLAGTLGFAELGEAAAKLDRHLASKTEFSAAYRDYLEQLDRVLTNACL